MSPTTVTCSVELFVQYAGLPVAGHWLASAGFVSHGARVTMMLEIKGGANTSVAVFDTDARWSSERGVMGTSTVGVVNTCTPCAAPAHA